MLRQHMLHANHAKTGFGKLGERAASVQTRICVQRFEFQISMKCLAVLDEERCIHSMEFAMTSKTQLTFNHPKTCGKKLRQ